MTEGKPRTAAGRRHVDAVVGIGGDRQAVTWDVLAIEAEAAEAASVGHAECEANMDAEIARLAARTTEPDEGLRDRIAEAIHDATPVEADGGVPDVCNHWDEHLRIADRALAGRPKAGTT